jgi:hypothetical protein
MDSHKPLVFFRQANSLIGLVHRNETGRAPKISGEAVSSWAATWINWSSLRQGA